MNKSPLLGIMLLIPAMFLFVAVGCSNKKKEVDEDDVPITKVKKTTPKKKDEITTPTEATVSGVVKLKGEAPKPAPIDAIKGHADSKTCLMGDTHVQTWHVKDGLVENVIVFLAPPPDKRFPDKAKEMNKKKFFLDQPFCQYVPHVVAVCPDSQKLFAKNSAAVNHNVKVQAGGDIGTIDSLMTPKQPDFEINLKDA